jgi:hypothetical protein
MMKEYCILSLPVDYYLKYKKHTQICGWYISREERSLFHVYHYSKVFGDVNDYSRDTAISAPGTAL